MCKKKKTLKKQKHEKYKYTLQLTWFPNLYASNNILSQDYKRDHRC